MVVIDASVWVALFRENDKFSEQAGNIIRTLALEQEKICISAIAFAEVAGVMKRITKNRNTAIEAVFNMKEMDPLVVVNFVELEPLATEIAFDYGVRGADAYYLAVAKLTKSKLYTFDQQQKEAFEAIDQTQ
jgi:predicted nucleic acid-binding protein